MAHKQDQMEFSYRAIATENHQQNELHKEYRDYFAKISLPVGNNTIGKKESYSSIVFMKNKISLKYIMRELKLDTMETSLIFIMNRLECKTWDILPLETDQNA